MFAVWGSRTQDAKLFSARNLDWNKDTGKLANPPLVVCTTQSVFLLGINRYKLVMVTVPNDGAIPSAGVGFVGLYGDLAGMSAEGIAGMYVCMNG